MMVMQLPCDATTSNPGGLPVADRKRESCSLVDDDAQSSASCTSVTSGVPTSVWLETPAEPAAEVPNPTPVPCMLTTTGGFPFRVVAAVWGKRSHDHTIHTSKATHHNHPPLLHCQNHHTAHMVKDHDNQWYKVLLPLVSLLCACNFYDRVFDCLAQDSGSNTVHKLGVSVHTGAHTPEDQAPPKPLTQQLVCQCAQLLFLAMVRIDQT